MPTTDSGAGDDGWPAFFVAVFENGDFEQYHAFATREEAEAYGLGLADAADLFGSGLDSYVLPDEDADMTEQQDASAVAAARKAQGEMLRARKEKR